MMIRKLFILLLSLGLIIANYVYGKESTKVNILDNNRNVINQYFEKVWNQGNIDILDEILSNQYINHNPGFEKPKPGPAGLKPIVSAIRKGFPDLKYIIERMVVAEDHVAIHVTMTGTHTGDFFGIPPTGKKINVSQMQIERIANGKMVEHWRVTDDLNMMRQLGQID